MTDLVIRPYEGVEFIEFDMTTDQVASVLGPTSFARQQRPDTDIEWFFDDPPICVTFDLAGRCNFVQFHRGAVGVVNGVRLIGRYEELVRALSNQDHPALEDTILTRFGEIWSGNTTLDHLGVVIRRETVEDKLITGAGVFRRGYWEAAKVARAERVRRKSQEIG